MSTNGVYATADPASVEAELDAQACALDVFGKALDEAVAEYNDADEAWLVLYDAVAETLREDYANVGRRSDPAEHVIVTETRRQHRAEYTRWKRAKRQVDLLEKRIQSTSKVLSARQTQSNGLREEMRAGVYSK